LRSAGYVFRTDGRVHGARAFRSGHLHLPPPRAGRWTLKQGSKGTREQRNKENWEVGKLEKVALLQCFNESAFGVCPQPRRAWHALPRLPFWPFPIRVLPRAPFWGVRGVAVAPGVEQRPSF